jgi:nicotinate-nucleotide pyrophosphorylase
MQGLDAHNSALWVANERRLDEQNRTQKFIITVAVAGYVEVEVEATSEEDAHEKAKESLDLVMYKNYTLTPTDGAGGMTVTDQFIADTEVVK